MQEKMLSIILPVHNGSEYIRKIIQEILSNPYQNLEVLVGDDGSTDSTAQEIKKTIHDPRVRVFSLSSRRGAGAMRNILLANARGEYIGIQDADDDFLSTRFVQQVDLLEQGVADVVGSHADLIDKSGKAWGRVETPQEPQFLSWIMQRSMVHASIVFRRDIAKNVFYHEGLEKGEDYYFLTQLYLKGARFRNICAPLYRYHIEWGKLRDLSLRKHWKVIRAKFLIAGLFPWYLAILFLCANFGILFVSYLKKLLRI